MQETKTNIQSIMVGSGGGMGKLPGGGGGSAGSCGHATEGLEFRHPQFPTPPPWSACPTSPHPVPLSWGVAAGSLWPLWADDPCLSRLKAAHSDRLGWGK